MPSAHDEALELARRPDGSLDPKRFEAEYERGMAERQARLTRDASAAARALDGWQRVPSQEHWLATVQQTDQDLVTGKFLIDRLGAERHLDPPLMAALLALRRRLIDDHGARTAAELMLIDSAILSYYHQLRVNGWIGDLAGLIEAHFFQRTSLTARLQAEYGSRADNVRGLKVEELVERLAGQLMPLLDRSNRMLLRNLKALKAIQEGPTPSVSIGSAGQINLATNQVNQAGGNTGAHGPKPARRRPSRARP